MNKSIERDIDHLHRIVASTATDITYKEFVAPFPSFYFIVIKNALLSELKTRMDDQWERYQEKKGQTF